MFQAKGLAAPSMVTDAITRYHLEDDSKDPELAQAIKDSAGSLYAGNFLFARAFVPPG